jgi:hypothetical protein
MCAKLGSWTGVRANARSCLAQRIGMGFNHAFMQTKANNQLGGGGSSCHQIYKTLAQNYTHHRLILGATPSRVSHSIPAPQGLMTLPPVIRHTTAPNKVGYQATRHAAPSSITVALNPNPGTPRVPEGSGLSLHPNLNIQNSKSQTLSPKPQTSPCTCQPSPAPPQTLDSTPSNPRP